MLRVFGQAFRTPDLRTKMLFTLSMIGIYRIGSYVPDARRRLSSGADAAWTRSRETASTR